MQKRLFLTGATGNGKTTLIRRALGDRLAMAGGFITEPALSPEGALLGYDLLPPAAVAGYDGFTPQRFLSFEDAGPVHDNEVYRHYGVLLLEEAAFYTFAVLDEFGGYELIIPQFRQALEDFLNTDVPCIGALKPRDEAELFRQYLGIGERYTQYNDRLWEALSQDTDTCILEMQGPEDEEAWQAVKEWVDQYCR